MNIIKNIKKWFDSIIEKLYFEQIGNYALYDKLTNIYNYNWLELIGYNKYKIKDIYITVIDLNNFKYINDTYGHLYGNKILQNLSDNLRMIKKVDKSIDIMRFGGDEFILFSSLNIYKQIKIINCDNLFSYGIYHKKENEDVEVSITKADHLMYINKLKRKNSKV